MAKLMISQEEKNRRGEIMRAGRRMKRTAVTDPNTDDIPTEDIPIKEAREEGKTAIGEIKGN